jgi:hypothetical protein
LYRERALERARIDSHMDPIVEIRLHLNDLGTLALPPVPHLAVPWSR